MSVDGAGPTELDRRSTKQYVGHLAFAVVHQAPGDIDAGHEGVIALCGVGPDMDELRSNPRFAELLLRLKLPDQAHCAPLR